MSDCHLRDAADDQLEFMIQSTWTRAKLLTELARILDAKTRAAVPRRKEKPVARALLIPTGPAARRAARRAKPTALGAYIFAGGFTYGVQDHFDVRAHFEDGPYGTNVATKIWPKLPIHTDVDAWPWEEHVDQVAFLYGNPPCAAWSPLGPRAQRGIDSWLRDPRVDCTRAHFQLLELIRPTVWAWESVPQAFTTGRPLVDHLTARAAKLGYAVDYVLHNAMYVGALQSRRRFFMVATKVDVDWACPWLECPSASAALAATPAEADARGIVRDSYYPLEFIRMLKPGDALRTVYPAFLEKLLKRHPNLTEAERKKRAPRPSFGERRLPADRPSGAVVDSMIVHPTEHRYLTLGEMKHLGGYPVDMPLEGYNHDARARLLTRAVLPPVGRWLAGEVRRAIDARKPVKPGRVREVNLFTPPGRTTVLAE
jgi:site-specific DNA-cytosine methylase